MQRETPSGQADVYVALVSTSRFLHSRRNLLQLLKRHGPATFPIAPPSGQDPPSPPSVHPTRRPAPGCTNLGSARSVTKPCRPPLFRRPSRQESSPLR